MRVWLVPIIASLVMAVPLSALSGVQISKRAPATFRLDSPYTLREPAIVKRAMRERVRLEAALSAQRIPAK